MSPIDRSVIESKLQQISERITHLEKFAAEGWEKYRMNFERRKAAEKLLQEMIEAAIDINTHLLADSGTAPPDYYSSFTLASAHGWIPEALAARLAPSAGLRNRLVHQYAGIDDKKVFKALQESTSLFRDYFSSVLAKLGTF